MEIWKKINNGIIDDRYIISSTGKVKDAITGFEYISKSKKHNLYIVLNLKCKDGTRKRFLLHRLVASTFIPNFNNYPIVNHIDENRQNNCVENLEWCTQKHNMNCWVKNNRGRKLWLLKE